MHANGGASLERLGAAAERVSRWRTLPVVLSCVAITSLYWLIVHYARNVPNADDFILCLKWLDAFEAARGGGKVALLFSHIGGHVLLVNRLASLVSFTLEGAVNFRAVIVTASVALLLTFLLLRRTLAEDAPDRAMAALPLALLLFQPQYAEATQWAAASWQVQWIHVFALLVLHLWDHSRRGMRLLAVVRALLATGCQGNGVLVFGVVALLAALRGEKGRAAAWGGLFAAALLAFHVSDAVAAAAGPGKHPLHLALYSLAYLGGALAYGSRARAIAAGALVVGMAAATAARGGARRASVAFGLLLFSIASAPANALGRAHLGIDNAYETNRYLLQSLVALASVYLCAVAIAAPAARACIVLSFAGLALAHAASGYASHVDDYRLRAEILDDSLVRWQVAGDGLATLDPPLARAVMVRSCALGLYRPPLVDPLPVAPAVEVAIPPEGPLQASVEHFYVTPDYVIVDGWAMSAVDGRPAPVYVAFVGRRRSLVFAAAPRTRPDVVALLRRSGQRVSGSRFGYFALVPREALGPVPYQVELIGSSGGRPVRVALGRTVPRLEGKS